MNNNEEKIEQKKRTDTVIGIVLASAFGLALNLIANLYYDLFVIHAITWADVDRFQVLAIVLVTVAMVGFLDFFIHDYKNDLEVNKSLWKRYSNYFFYEFTPGKILRVIFGVYMLLILGGFLILFYITLLQVWGFWTATSAFAGGSLLAYIKERRQRQS